MTIKSIRLENLRLLVSIFGSERALADLSDTSEGYLREIMRGDKHPSGEAKGVGDKLARKLEAGCGKPEGWMDKSQSETPQDPAGENLTPDERTLLTLYRRAAPELRELILHAARLAKRSP